MRDLKHRTLWIGVGTVMVAAVIVLSLVPPPVQVQVPWWDKASHFAAYFVLMLWFASIYADRATHHLLAAGFIGLGVALEFAQLMTGYRMMEVTDMAANGAGAAAAWGLARTRAAEGLVWVETRLGSGYHG
jgi:VanZ family protein